MKRTFSVAAVLVVLLPLSAAAAGAPAAKHPLAVTGYALGGTSGKVISASAKALTTVTVVGVGISPNGATVSKPDPSMASVRKIAHRHGLRAELLVSNYNDALGDFDTRSAHELLSSTSKINRLARTMAGYVARGRSDGVNIDLELVQKRDAAGLVRLARALQNAMPTKKSVSIDVSASTSVAGYRDHGYDLKKLAAAVDVIQVMAYDQHGPGWSGPGPVGGLQWQRKALAALVSQVPRSKVDLGQAGYGYTWPTSGGGRNVTDREARALVRKDGAKAVCHRAQGEWSATLSNGTRLWWADARSYAIRKQVARNQRLHGLAVWVLGSADTLT